MSRNFGYARKILTAQTLPSLEIKTFKSQADSLLAMGNQAEKDSVSPLVRNTALRIINDCKSRGDDCELEQIFRTVRDGNEEIAPFVNGFKYVADPRYADYFTSAVDSITNCLKHACGGDCDDHTILVTALCASTGWKVGLRAWGPEGVGGYSHVYAVVAYPKRPSANSFQRVVGMDTTVAEASVGWEPPEGNVLTAWLT